MDWARAKTILIIVFLLLNLFLFSALLFNNSNVNFQSDYSRYAIEYLSSRKIHVEAKIPSVSGKLGVVYYGTRVWDTSILSRMVFGNEVQQIKDEFAVVFSQGNEEILIENQMLVIKDKLDNGKDLYQEKEAFSDFVYQYLKRLGIKRENISLQKMEAIESENRMSFVMKYKNSLLFDQQLTASINSEGYLYLDIPAREVKRENTPDDPILSVYQIMVMAQLPYGSTVEGIDFGYKKIGEEDVADSPVWRITLKDGQTLFYDASTGDKVL